VVENQAGLKPGQVRVDGSVLVIGTGDNALKILEIQRAGGKRLSIVEFLRAEQNQNWP